MGWMEERWGTIGGVRWVREAARGRAWPYAQSWGKPQHWGSHGPLPALQLLFILNSWHIMGIQALGVLQAGHGDPRSFQLACHGTTRKPVFTSPHWGTHVKVLQGNIQNEKCSCGGTRGYIKQPTCGMVLTM